MNEANLAGRRSFWHRIPWRFVCAAAAGLAVLVWFIESPKMVESAAWRALQTVSPLQHFYNLQDNQDFHVRWWWCAVIDLACYTALPWILFSAGPKARTRAIHGLGIAYLAYLSAVFAMWALSGSGD